MVSDLLYQCSSNFSDSVLDDGHECYHPNMPDAFLTCETVIFAPSSPSLSELPGSFLPLPCFSPSSPQPLRAARLSLQSQSLQHSWCSKESLETRDLLPDGFLSLPVERRSCII